MSLVCCVCFYFFYRDSMSHTGNKCLEYAPVFHASHEKLMACLRILTPPNRTQGPSDPRPFSGPHYGKINCPSLSQEQLDSGTEHKISQNLQLAHS